jgi:hypothetical protein
MAEQTKIFLGGLAGNFTIHDLNGLFSSLNYRSITKIDLVRSKKDPKINAGYGFMLVQSQQEAKRILKTHQFKLKGRMFVAKAYKKGNDLEKFQDEVQKRRLFVHTIDPNMNNEDLKSFFGRIVDVEDGYIVKRKGNSFNIGYLMVRKVEDAWTLVKKKKFSFGSCFCIVLPYEKRLEAKEKKIQQYLQKNMRQKKRRVAPRAQRRERQRQEGGRRHKNSRFQSELCSYVNHELPTENNSPWNNTQQNYESFGVYASRADFRLNSKTHTLLYKGQFLDTFNCDPNHSQANIRLNPNSSVLKKNFTKKKMSLSLFAEDEEKQFHKKKMRMSRGYAEENGIFEPWF